MLQCVAVRVRKSALLHPYPVSCILYCVAVWYRVLQSVTECCRVLESVGECCSVLQCENWTQKPRPFLKKKQGEQRQKR